jgi:hypothetical protein
MMTFVPGGKEAPPMRPSRPHLYRVEANPGINVPTFIRGRIPTRYKCGHIYTGVNLHQVQIYNSHA